MEGENIIADMRFRAVNWGRENPQSHVGGGGSFQGVKSGSKQEREQLIVFT